jgi:hypothetical protein
MKITQTFFTQDLKDYLNKDDKDNEGYISDFRKVNFLIGPNNSGKSRILRSLFYGQTNSIFSDKETVDIERQATKLLERLNSYGVTETGNVPTEFIEYLTKGVPFDSESNEFSLNFEVISNFNFNPDYDNLIRVSGISGYNLTNFKRELAGLFVDIKNLIEKYRVELLRKKPEFIYIPIIRGTRPLAGNSNNDIYVERTKKDYFSNIEESKFHSIFGGDNLYKEVEDLLLGNADKRSLIFEYEEFLSKHFFHKKVTIIPQRGKDVLLIKIGDEEERLIYDLGDGVQAIILLTFPVFIRKDKNCIFFIEEPELNLHPSLQRRILNCLSVEFPDHQYFISTHSNHFLEGLSEYENVALFSFKKSFAENKFHVQKLTSIKTDILDNLGVKNSSVLMANCTIWVEGITDRLYIQKFLEVYTNSKTEEDKLNYPLFKEDQHYSFVEYAGSNITHWDFEDSDDNKINAAYVANSILLISDTDYNKSGNIPPFKIQRFEKLKFSLGDNFVLIDGKEIENILTPIIVHEIVADYEKSTVDKINYTKSKFVHKKKNVGEWINNSFSPISRNYAKENTISDKTNFCKKAISKITTINDLSEEAINLCEKIYSFIKGNNSAYIEES